MSWRNILVQIKAKGITEQTSLNSKNLIEWLFDIDRLTRQVKLVGNSIQTHFDRRQSDKEKQLYRFITSLLKIELWLLGYEGINPNGMPMYFKKTYKQKW